ncbi:MAG: cellulase family glycosylhydrolase [Pseudomonadota bacterium]
MIKLFHDFLKLFFSSSGVLLCFSILPITAIAIENINKQHNLGQLRGAMVGPNIVEADFEILAKQWKTNHIRWIISWEDSDYWDKNNLWHRFSDTTNISLYWDLLDAELDKLDRVLDYARNNGLVVLIDLHTSPGGRDSSDVNLIFKQQKYLDEYYEVWKVISERYKGNTTVWGYDLLNEPIEQQNSNATDSWAEIATEAANRIRAIDSEAAIIYEPAPWSFPSAFNNLEPLDVDGVVYSFHLYFPHAFTHQGVRDHGPRGVSYPAFIDGELWNKERLIKAVQPVVDFQNKYSVPIYIGEFGAVRWGVGNSSYQYMKDSIEIFEDNNWDWSYHAYKDGDDKFAWSVEHGNNYNDLRESSTITERKKLLLFWFEKNKQANFLYSIYPDQNSHLYFDRDVMLACNLAVIFDDQSKAGKIFYDVVWGLDTRLGILNPVSAIPAENNCNRNLLPAFIPAIDNAGYSAFFDQQKNTILADNITLRTCTVDVKFPENNGLRAETNIDIDWYFNKSNGSWNYYFTSATDVNCLNKPTPQL